MNKICAGIVLYNPDIDRLEKNIRSVKAQIKDVFLIDNNSTNKIIIDNIAKKYQCSIVYNESNMGIAVALNQIIELADENGFEWVLTLDQDSIIPINMLSEYQNCILPGIAIICPMISSTVTKEINNNQNYEYVSKSITSGSLTNVRYIKNVGGFDEKMFIDLVDFELCMRLEQNEYKILRANNVILDHQLGNEDYAPCLYFLSKLLNNETLRRFALRKNYSGIRTYYFFRNSLYVNKKHKNYINKKVKNREFRNSILHLIIVDKNRILNLKMLVKAIRDYKNML